MGQEAVGAQQSSGEGGGGEVALGLEGRKRLGGGTGAGGSRKQRKRTQKLGQLGAQSRSKTHGEKIKTKMTRKKNRRRVGEFDDANEQQAGTAIGEGASSSDRAADGGEAGSNTGRGGGEWPAHHSETEGMGHGVLRIVNG